MHLISVTNTLYYIYSLVQLEVLYTEIYSYFGIRVYFNSSDVQFFNDTIALITRILNDVELEIQALEIIISGSTTTTLILSFSWHGHRRYARTFRPTLTSSGTWRRSCRQ